MSSADLVERHIRTKRKVRTIVTYADNGSFLRQEHERILHFLRANSYPSLFAKAYIPHRGIFENAKAHLYNDVFIKLDIKNFFASINHRRLQTQLYIELNKVSEEYVSREQCRGIVSICSCGYPGLPLGLVTSPDLANIYLKGFDSFLYGKLKKYNVQNPIYTRYADDIVVSFKYRHDYLEVAWCIICDVERLLKEYSLYLNRKKVQIISLDKSNHVKITGINITKRNDNFRHITVGKKLINKLFWRAIHYYDHPEYTSDLDVERLKGLLSFVFSIEKNGFYDRYSLGMLQLIKNRGFLDLEELILSLPNRVSAAQMMLQAMEVIALVTNLSIPKDSIHPLGHLSLF